MCVLFLSGEQLNFLMDTVASGHTFMDTEQTYHATRLVIESLTLEVRYRAARYGTAQTRYKYLQICRFVFVKLRSWGFELFLFGVF